MFFCPNWVISVQVNTIFSPRPQPLSRLDTLKKGSGVRGRGSGLREKTSPTAWFEVPGFTLKGVLLVRFHFDSGDSAGFYS